MKKDSNTTLVPNENENTFNGLSNDPIFYLRRGANEDQIRTGKTFFLIF